MFGGKRKLVWFNSIFDRYLLDYAEGQGNFSGYVKGLILKDFWEKLKTGEVRRSEIGL